MKFFTKIAAIKRKPGVFSFRVLMIVMLCMGAGKGWGQVSHLVISQVYGGGGNASATYKRDFVELFNPTGASININGYSIQYAATSGTTWQNTGALPNVSIPSGKYYLISMQTSDGANGASLPTIDFTSGANIDMAAGNGKVALLNTSTTITSGTSCPSGGTLVDLVGYGTANCFEGAGAAPAASAANSATRKNSGCTDSDVNSSDFLAATASARNSASTANFCSPATQALNITSSNIQTSQFDFNWTDGTGSKRAVFIKATNTGTASPVNNTTYTANTVFTSGTQIGATGWYCVFNGTTHASAITVTGLSASTIYRVMVCEYNGTALAEAYNIAAATNNPINVTTSAAGCTAPSTQASALSTSSPATNQFNVSWTAGDGNGTMIVIRPTAQSILAPSSGTSYTADPDYSLAGQINANNRVVFRAAGTAVTPTNLNAGTQYTVTAYEYNTTGDCYNLTSPLSSSIYTLSAEPTAHAASFSAVAASPTSINLSFSAASSITNAAGYIILQKQAASAPTGTPTDATGYSVGNTIGDATVAAIITSTASTSATISSLSASTQYYYTLIPYNWDGSNNGTYNYYTAATIPSATATTSALSAPSISSPTATAITNTTATLGGNVTSDGGAAISARGVVWAQTSLNSNPTIGGANTTNVVGSGTTGVFTVSATSLPVATQISYAAYATNSQGTTYTTVPTFYTLANQPTTLASAIVFGTPTINSISLSWTSGNGANRIVVARLTATTRVGPTNGTDYAVNSASFTDGLNSQTGTGNVVIYNGTGSSVTVTGLSSITSYTFDIYEYNGTGVTANYTANFSGSKSTLNPEPVNQAASVTFTNVTQTSFTVNWVKGADADNSLVVIKDGSAVDSDPVDGTSYSAGSNVFGAGSQLGTGNYVVYRASLATINVTGLTDGHTYYVAVYSYKGSAGSGLENYLIASPATGNQLASLPTYYSQSSADPTTLANWNTVRAGGGSTPANFTTAANFVIQNTHNMTTAGSWSFGGTGSTLEIENGGTLTANNAITVAGGATFKIDGGGTYVHNNASTPSTTIFNGTENFAATSNFKINSWASNTTVITSGMTLPYGNLEVNWTGNTQNWQQSLSGTVNLCAGNLIITSVGSGSLRFTASGTPAITVSGNFAVNCSGTVDFGSSSNGATINLGGDLSQSAGTIITSGSGFGAIITNGTGSNTWTFSGGTRNFVVFTISAGKTITLASNFVIGTSSATGQILINQGTLDAADKVITAGPGPYTIQLDGIFKTSNLNGFSGSSTTAISNTNTPTIAFGSSSTINYSAASTQAITPRADYVNLAVSGGGTKTLASAATVSGTLTMTSGNIDCGSSTLELGTSTSTVGTLAYTSGNVIGNFKRWINATGTAINFPVGTASANMNAKVTFTNLTNGSLTAKFNASNPGSTGLPLAENSLYISNQFTEGYWSLIAANSLASTNYDLELTGTGFTSHTQNASTRIIKRAAAGSWSLSGAGTHVAAVGAVAKRAGLSGFSEFDQADTYTPAATDYFRSITSGDWNNAGTWESSPDGTTWYAATSTPDNTANTITIQSPHTVTVTASVSADQLTINSGGKIIVNGSQTFTINDGSGTDITVDGTLETAGTITNNGTAQINNTLQIDQGGWPGNTGTYTYGASGALVFNTSSGLYNVNSNDTWWPGSSGPVNVTIQNGGAINMNGITRTVTGTFLLVTGSNAVQGTALNLDGITQINGGNFQTTPTYGPLSTLIYNTTYGTFNEWTGGATTSVAAGSGVPANVTVQSGTVTLAGGRGVPGNITVNSGAGVVLNASSGDLYIGGSLSNSGSTWTNNTRAVVFVTDGAATITAASGTQFFDYLLINKNSGSVKLGASTNVTINSTAGDVLQILGAGTLDLDGHTLTLNNNGGNILASGGSRTITSTAVGGILDVTNNKTISGASGGTLTIANNVTVRTSAGINFGGVTTLAGTLKLLAGGFVDTNTPTYTGTSTLYYNTGNYTNSIEWGAGASAGSGVPQNVTINLTGANTVSLAGSRNVPGTLTLTNGALSIGANTLTINNANSTSGTLTGTAASNVSTSNLAITGAAGTLSFTQTDATTRSLNDLTLSGGGSVTLGNPLDVYHLVDLTTGSGSALHLNGQHLTLKSNTINTARITNLTGCTLDGASNVTVERFIKLRFPGTGEGSGNNGRAYRVLGPTVNSTGSINANWQEGQMNTAVGTPINTVPGYGTNITGSGANANGFDITQSNAPSLYYTTNGTTLSYTAATNTNVATLDAKIGYFLYVRGDRSVATTVPLGDNMPTTSTTLRATGTLLTGDQTFTTGWDNTVGAMNLVTNPYASPIDGTTLMLANVTNVAPTYTIWDPNNGQRGGFVTVLAGVPSSGLATNFIQSGQGFFVQSTGVGTSFTVSESQKTTTDENNNGVFKNTTGLETFSTTLYYTESTGTHRIADGAVVIYDNAYSPAVDNNDAREVNNWDENIAIARSGKHLAIETRPVVQQKDTIPLFMNNMRQMAYQFQFAPSNFTNTLLKAELIDNFLATRTLLSVTDTVLVSFSITADPASSANNRFMVVFTPVAPLAIDVTTIKAYQKNAGVQVEWTAKTETDMDHYEVERSFDGIQFGKQTTVAAVGNSNAAVNYNWFDAGAQVGNNFYRVKAIDKSGQVKYTSIVKVTIGKGQPAMVIYPNPVAGNSFSVQLTNLDKGTYAVSLYNELGQQVLSTQVEHAGGTATKIITANNALVKGTYQLLLTGVDIKLSVTIIKN